MKQLFQAVLLILMLLAPWTASAEVPEEYAQVQKIRLMANACLAAYSDMNGKMIKDFAEQEGWTVGKFAKVDNHLKADVQFILAKNSRLPAGETQYLLAVAGTESRLDIKVDLRVKKVYFAGATLEEFAENASKTDMPTDAPKVHEGFNQVAQILLSAEVADSAGNPRLLTEQLRDNPNFKVYLTGHSLGGATVMLVAARLLDMGIQPEQLEVITFGAPTVGNEAFVQKYTDKFALMPIVIEGDPVPIILRRVYGGFRALGTNIVWKPEGAVRNYSLHSMAVYLDQAIKHHLDLRRQATFDGSLPLKEALPDKPRLYLTQPRDGLPNDLQEEWGGMRQVLLHRYDDILPGYLMDRSVGYDETARRRALSAGCDLVGVPEISAEKMPNDLYKVTLSHKIYRAQDGKLVHSASYSQIAQDLTPLEAFLVNTKFMYNESAAWSSGK